MYQARHLQYINLPKVPDEIVQDYLQRLDSVEAKWHAPDGSGYIWSDSNNEQVNSWCQKNICADMYWGFQLMTTDVPVHTDQGTVLKFVYVIQTGGDAVQTEFWQDGKITESYQILPHRWHTLKVDSEHSVTGIEPGKRRISVTGRIF